MLRNFYLWPSQLIILTPALKPPIFCHHKKKWAPCSEAPSFKVPHFASHKFSKVFWTRFNHCTFLRRRPYLKRRRKRRMMQRKMRRRKRNKKRKLKRKKRKSNYNGTPRKIQERVTQAKRATLTRAQLRVTRASLKTTQYLRLPFPPQARNPPHHRPHPHSPHLLPPLHPLERRTRKREKRNGKRRLRHLFSQLVEFPQRCPPR